MHSLIWINAGERMQFLWLSLLTLDGTLHSKAAQSESS